MSRFHAEAIMCTTDNGQTNSLRTVQNQMSAGPTKGEKEAYVQIGDGDAESAKTAAPIWTGTITKVTEDAKVGISFGGDGTQLSPLVIAFIRPGGLVDKHTNLSVGLQVLSINGISVETGCSAEVLATMVRTAGIGDLTIKAKGVVATTKEAPQGRRIGISLYKDATLGGDAIVIGRILPDSMLANSGLKEGQRITYINNEPCPKSTRDAVRMMLNSQGKLRIVAIDGIPRLAQSLSSSIRSQGSAISATQTSASSSALPSPPYRMIVQSQKASGNNQQPCGLGIQKDKASGVIFIKTIAPQSIFEDTPLQSGHIISKINGKQCPNNTRDTVKMIQSLDSTILLEVIGRQDIMDRISNRNPPTKTAGNHTGTTPKNYQDEKQQNDPSSSSRRGNIVNSSSELEEEQISAITTEVSVEDDVSEMV